MPSAAVKPTAPPSSSGLGHRPFKAAARVRIPLGARPAGRWNYFFPSGLCTTRNRPRPWRDVLEGVAQGADQRAARLGMAGRLISAERVA